MFMLAATLASALIVFGSDRAAAQGTQLFAVLVGGDEVSGGGAADQGDPDGYGAASLIFAGPGRLCYSIVVHGIDQPTAAHVHRGRAGVPGPIVIPLMPPAGGNPGRIAGCVSGIDQVLLNEVRVKPSLFYVNVHTGIFSAGALRGQLF
jgi:hypothetical protein